MKDCSTNSLIGATRLGGAASLQTHAQSLLTNSPLINSTWKGVLDGGAVHLSVRGEKNPRGKPKLDYEKGLFFSKGKLRA